MFIVTPSDLKKANPIMLSNYLNKLNRLQESLFEIGSLDEKLKKITSGVVKIFRADFSRIWISKPGDLCNSGCLHTKVKEGPDFCRFRDQCLHLVASSGRYTHIDGPHCRMPFGLYKLGRIAAGEVPKFLTNNVTQDPQIMNHQWAKELGLVSFGGYKLQDTCGKAIGVLAFFSKQDISHEHDSLLQGLASTTARVIQSGKEQEALQDMANEICDKNKEIKAFSKNLQRKVEEKTKELKDKNGELEQIIYITLHDMRTPLVNIHGFTREILKQSKNINSIINSKDNFSVKKMKLAPSLDEDFPKMFDYIFTSISKMDNLIFGLLRILRLGKANMELTQLDINELLISVKKTVEYQIKQVGAKLEIGELPYCLGDMNLINQVFSNLLANALKYLDPKRKGVIKITGQIKESKAIFCIEDNGIGISSDNQKNIFNMFHRVNPKSTVGEGLGLTVCQKIVVMHGGTMWVESEPDKGSKFYVSISERAEGC